MVGLLFNNCVNYDELGSCDGMMTAAKEHGGGGTMADSGEMDEGVTRMGG